MDVKRLVFIAVCIFTQNAFADETKIMKNITLASEDHDLLKNQSMKDIENVTVQYIYPNNNFRKEISSKKNRTERFLYIGMEDVNDAVLIFPSLVNVSSVNIHEKNDTILETTYLKKIDTNNESKSIEVDNSEYHSKGKSDNNKIKKKTSEAKAKNLSVSTDSETKNSKLRERLANLSKLRFKNLKNAKPKLVDSSTESQDNITENTTIEETVVEKSSVSPNTSQILLRDENYVENISTEEPEPKLYMSMLNGTVNNTNLLTSDSLIEKQSVTLKDTQILFQDKIHMKNNSMGELYKKIINETVNSTELPMYDSLIDEIYTTETATISVLNSSFTDTILPDITDDDDMAFEKRSLIDESILANNSYIYESNVTSYKESPVSNENTSTQHEIPNFHVEMIPFTIEDVMITSGSESKNYWATSEDNYTVEEEVYPSQKMIENMIKNQVLDARKRSKKFTSLLKKKVFSKSDKNIEKTSENFQKNSYIPQENVEKKSIVNTLKNSHYSDQSEIYLYEKNMNEADITPAIKHIDPNPATIFQQISPFKQSYSYEKTVDTAAFEESLKELPWYKNLQYYMPSEQPVQSRVGDLLIVGPIPKSLPSQFKYEPYKDQMRLPKF